MRRNGCTPAKTLGVLLADGLIMALGRPRLRQALVRSDVRSARLAVAATCVRAREPAVATNRNAAMLVDADRVPVMASLRRMPAAGSTRELVRISGSGGVVQ